MILQGLDGDDRPPYLWAAALAPPAAIAAVFGNPSLFFAAVDLAGVYGILVLFGVVPALMAWGSRYGAAALDADDAAPEAPRWARMSRRDRRVARDLGAIAGFAAGRRLSITGSFRQALIQPTFPNTAPVLGQAWGWGRSIRASSRPSSKPRAAAPKDRPAAR